VRRFVVFLLTREDFLDFFVRIRDDVDRNELADAAGGGRS